MRRHLPLLLVMVLAMTVLANANDAAEPTTESIAVSPFSVLANATVSCSAAWPSSTVGCWLERPLLVLGSLELAVGVDAQAALRGGLEDAHLAPYLIAAAYLDSWSAWAEVRLPELSGIPALGAPDWLRVGFTYRIPP